MYLKETIILIKNYNQMLEKILRKTEKLIPRALYKFFQPTYHYLLALAGNIIYKFPSKKLKIVGITGTKGKSTVTELVNGILEEAGYKTSIQSTIRFKIGEESHANKYKMSMPGRFFMQKFLHDSINEKCDWVILEMTSEGVKQFRHTFIDLDALIFTNLAPEHIESHGSYEKYRDAKLKIGDRLQQKENTLLVVNKDDEVCHLFLEKEVPNKVSFSLDDARPFKLDSESSTGIEIPYKNTTIYSKLHGEFNIYNILAAINFAEAIGINEEIIKKGIESVEMVPGRVQKIENSNAYVDYAHTPESLEALYRTFENKKKICVLGNTGGGRDTWKRPEMAKIADKYCDHIILTNEDPYEEDPQKIIDEMKVAISKTPLDIILDRREAINHALSLSMKEDPKASLGQDKNNVVLITGKGTDPYIMEANGKRTPWSDAGVVKEGLEKLDKK